MKNWWIFIVISILLLLILFNISNFQTSVTGKASFMDIAKRILGIAVTPTVTISPTPSAAPETCYIDDKGNCYDREHPYPNGLEPNICQGSLAVYKWECLRKEFMGEKICVAWGLDCSKQPIGRSACNKKIKIENICYLAEDGTPKCGWGCTYKDGMCQNSISCFDSWCNYGNPDKVCEYHCELGEFVISRGQCVEDSGNCEPCKENEVCEEKKEKYMNGERFVAKCVPKPESTPTATPTA